MFVIFVEGLVMFFLVNEIVDNEFVFFIIFGDEFGYEFEFLFKEKEVVKFNNNNFGWRMLDGSRKEVDFFRFFVNFVRENDWLGEEEEDDIFVFLFEEE